MVLMAIKIPTYTSGQQMTKQSSGVTSMGGERIQPAIQRSLTKSMAPSDIKWKAVQEFSNTITNINDRMEEAERVEQVNDGIMTINNELQSYLDDLRTNPDYNNLSPDEHEKLYEKRKEQLTKQLKENTTNTNAWKQIERKIDEKSLIARTKTREIGWRRQIDRGKTKLVNNIENLVDRFVDTGDPTILGDIKESIGNAESAGYISGEQSIDLSQRSYMNAVNKYWQKVINLDPMNAEKLIKEDPNGTFGEMFNDYDKSVLIEKAKRAKQSYENEIKRKNAESRTALKNDANDYLAYLQTGGEIQPEFEQKYKAQMGNKDFNELKEKRDFSLKIGSIKQDIKFTSLEDDTATLNEFDNTPVTMESGVQDLKFRDAKRKEIINKWSIINKDPAQWVISSDQNLKDDINGRLTAQETMGISKPKPLTKTESDNLINTIVQLKDGGQLKAQMATLTEQYGEKNVGKIKKQLFEDGLPTKFRLALALPMNQAEEIDVLFNAAKTKESEFKDLLPKFSKKKTDIIERVNKSLSDWKASVRNTTNQTGIINDYQDSMVHAIMYMMSIGYDEDEALTKVTGIFNDRYVYDDGIRYPRNFPITQMNKVKDNVLDSITIENVDPPNNEPDKKFWLENTKKNGFWVNNNDDTGIFLKDQLGRFVYDNNGKKVEIKFKQLPELMKQQNDEEAPYVENYLMGPMM
jgi:hypothetical protein